MLYRSIFLPFFTAYFYPQTSHGVAISTLLKKQTENELVGSSYPLKKKRKLWTKEEDKELIASVRKFGEGNWANILRENLKLDRTPSQLSQRWSIIRKRDANIFAVTSTAAMASKSMPTVGTTAPSLANPVPSSYNTKPGGQQVQGCSVEVVKNLQNAGSDTIPHDLLGKEVGSADDSELYKLVEFDMDLSIENDVGNANDASESAAPKSHAAKELLTEHADSKVVSSVSETDNLKSG